MRHLPLRKIKFLSGRACVNRPDGASLHVIQRLRPGDHVYGGPPYLRGTPQISEINTYDLILFIERVTKHVWYGQEPIMVQALINAFRQGVDLVEIDHAAA